MSDPLTDLVSLLQPNAALSKLVEGAGAWHVPRSEPGASFYCAVLEGSCWLRVRGETPVALAAGDFVLIPSADDFATSSLRDPGRLLTEPVQLRPGVYRLGKLDGAAEVRLLLGYGTFGSDDAKLLVPLLPQLVHVRDEPRLTTLVELVDQESRRDRLGRDVVLARLVEVLMIEALRSTADPSTVGGLLRGLADERLAVALRRIHERPTWPWTVAALAREAAMSRSAFFGRFRSAVGIPPMEYVLRWRMTLAKDLLRRKDGSVAEVAERVGYSSASTFSVAFARYVGQPPAAYARAAMSQGPARPASCPDSSPSRLVASAT